MCAMVMRTGDANFTGSLSTSTRETELRLQMPSANEEVVNKLFKVFSALQGEIDSLKKENAKLRSKAAGKIAPGLSTLTSKVKDEAEEKISALQKEVNLLKKENAELQSRLTRKIAASERILKDAIKLEYRHAAIGASLGLLAILCGAVLCLHGFVGATSSWTADLFGLKSNLNDAAPGVVLFIIGLFVVILTRPNIKLGNLTG